MFLLCLVVLPLLLCLVQAVAEPRLQSKLQLQVHMPPQLSSPVPLQFNIGVMDVVTSFIITQVSRHVWGKVNEGWGMPLPPAPPPNPPFSAKPPSSTPSTLSGVGAGGVWGLGGRGAGWRSGVDGVLGGGRGLQAPGGGGGMECWRGGGHGTTI